MAQFIAPVVMDVGREVARSNLVSQQYGTVQGLGDGAHQAPGQQQTRHQHQQHSTHCQPLGIAALRFALCLGFIAAAQLKVHKTLLRRRVLGDTRRQALFHHAFHHHRIALGTGFLHFSNHLQNFGALLHHALELGFVFSRKSHLLDFFLQYRHGFDIDLHLCQQLGAQGLVCRHQGIDQPIHRQLRQPFPAGGQQSALFVELHQLGRAAGDIHGMHLQTDQQAHHDQ